jgi:hypothetical protein
MLKDLNPDSYKIMADPGPGGPKTYGSYGIRIHNTANTLVVFRQCDNRSYLSAPLS